MKTHLTIRLQLPGFHSFDNVAEVYPSNPEIWFLGQPHRHMFHFECVYPVVGLDRELEFFILRKHVEDIIRNINPTLLPLGELNFGSRSCETIATAILKEDLRMSSCTVSEDGENSATVTR